MVTEAAFPCIARAPQTCICRMAAAGCVHCFENLTCMRRDHAGMLSHMLQVVAHAAGACRPASLSCVLHLRHVIMLHTHLVTRTARVGRHRAQQGRGEWARV